VGVGEGGGGAAGIKKGLEVYGGVEREGGEWRVKGGW